MRFSIAMEARKNQEKKGLLKCSSAFYVHWIVTASALCLPLVVASSVRFIVQVCMSFCSVVTAGVVFYFFAVWKGLWEGLSNVEKDRNSLWTQNWRWGLRNFWLIGTNKLRTMALLGGWRPIPFQTLPRLNEPNICVFFSRTIYS